MRCYSVPEVLKLGFQNFNFEKPTKYLSIWPKCSQWMCNCICFELFYYFFAFNFKLSNTEMCDVKKYEITGIENVLCVYMSRIHDNDSRILHVVCVFGSAQLCHYVYSHYSSKAHGCITNTKTQTPPVYCI